MSELWSGVTWFVGWVGWLGLGLGPVLVAIAVIVFVPSFRQIAIIAASIWIAAFGLFTAGDHYGASRIQAKWDAAIINTEKQVDEARENAERTVPLEPHSVRTHDPYNRDNR